MSESSSGQPSDPPAPESDALPAKGPDAGPTRPEAAPFELSQEPVTPEGEGEPGDTPAAPAPAYEHLGELPTTYGTQSVYLVAYDPGQLFTYWDVDWTSGPNTPYALRVCRADGTLEQQVDIVASEAGRYLPAGTPGGTYFVELGRYGRDGRWHVVATSTPVTMPPAGLAGDTEPKFATLPFHLSFHRLMELIHTAMGKGEDLTAALARLQEGDRPGLRVIAGTAARLGPGPLHTLEMLLGQKFHVSSGGDSSAPAAGGEGDLPRDRHDVLAAGAFSSEDLSSAGLSSGGGFGGGSENLSSGGFPSGEFGRALGGASENLASGGLSSGEFGRALGGGSENLASGAFSSGVLGSALGGASENLSSGAFSSGGFGGVPGIETLAAFAAGLSSESLSSFGGSGGSLPWHLLGGASSGSGGFGGGGSDDAARDRADALLRALESHLGVLGGLFSGMSSGGSGSFGS